MQQKLLFKTKVCSVGNVKAMGISRQNVRILQRRRESHSTPYGVMKILKKAVKKKEVPVI